MSILHNSEVYSDRAEGEEGKPVRAFNKQNNAVKHSGIVAAYLSHRNRGGRRERAAIPGKSHKLLYRHGEHRSAAPGFGGVGGGNDNFQRSNTSVTR